MISSHEARQFWCLEQIDLFRKLPKREQDRIESISKMVSYKKGETIFLPGDPSDTIYFLRKGRIKLAHLDVSGRRLTLHICQRGEPFGEMALAGEDQRSLIAEALDDVELCVASKSDLIKLAQESPALSLKITKIIGLRFIEVKNRLDDLLFKDVKTRLARLLLKLGDQFGAAEENGMVINLRLTHQDLADLIGSTRETASVTISDFEGSGWIAKSGRNFSLKNPEALKKQANS